MNNQDIKTNNVGLYGLKMKQIVSYLKSCSTKEIVVIGDVMLDEYWFGSVSRVSPEAPVPVLKQESKEWCLGGAANVAANCKHIGFNVSLVGVVGAADSAGALIASMIREIGIDGSGLIKSDQRVTTCKQRMMVKGHQLLRVDQEVVSPLLVEEQQALRAALNARLCPGVTVLISDYAKGVVTRSLIEYVVERVAELGGMVLVDPKGPDFSKYLGVDYIKPNIHEFKQMMRFFGIADNEPLEVAGRVLCAKLGLKGLFVTLGEQGIQFVSEQTSLYCPVFKREVFDLTGAGDTVFAFLAFSLSNGLPIGQCLQVANRAAAVAVSHLKTYAVSLDELIDREADPIEKVFSDWTRLKIEIDWIRRGKKRVVFTNGCFDILHSGHIHLLKEAKRLGDILVVGLNTDESVRRLGKGPGRPINQLAERAALVAALGMVDFVVSFDQDTPRELIEYLNPDVLVKGGDYKIETIVGHDYVTALGGSVKVIDYVPGRSTTTIVNHMEAAQKGRETNV